MLHSHKGFTLLELAIVMTVAALLVAGVMGAKHMIDAAQLNSVIGDIEKFSNAADSFETMYGALPGDIADISAIPTLTPPLLPGNGNGRVDTTNESLQFWYHLRAAGLIAGAFDGSSANIPASDGRTGGVPAGKIPGSGYTITNDPALGVIFTLARFSDTSATLPVLTPAEAHSIDKRLDDGNPSTGIIRAIDGTGMTAKSCNKGALYANDTGLATCVVQFAISRKTSTTSARTSVSCNGSPAGTSRISTTAACPTGYGGSVIETCIARNTAGVWSGAWQNTRRLCNIVNCGNGSVAGETRQLPCPTGYDSGSVTQICHTTGVWKETANTCHVSENENCTTLGRLAYHACPLGQTGSITQQCKEVSSLKKWQTIANSCQAFLCSDAAIGDAVSPADCPSGYNGGNVVNACTLAGVQAVGNTCLPPYQGCTANSTRGLSCPAGSAGTHWQRCNSTGFWETDTSPGKGYGCVPATCGGAPIGTVRQTAGIQCPQGSVGTVVELCTANGTWQINTTNCGQRICPETSDTANYAHWVATPAGTANAPSDRCLAGASRPGLAVRDCETDGNWGPVRGGCLQDCPATSADNANWVQTIGETTATVGMGGNACASGYVPGPGVSKQCLGGTRGWGPTVGQCYEGVQVNGADFW